MPPKPLKFAIIADAHIGSAQPTKPPTRFPERARALLRYVVSQLNTEYKPDFVVQLGGLIAAEDADEDEGNVETGVEILRELQMPVHHAMGVDELTHLPAAQVGALLKVAKPYYSFAVGGVSTRGIVLCPERAGDEWCIGKAQLEWLAKELQGDEKSAVVFSYFPLVDFETEESEAEGEDEAIVVPAQLSNRADVRNALAQSSKVRAVFSAHWHMNSLVEVGGIHYMTIQSLVQNVAGARPSESFGIAKFFEDEAIIEVVGMDPMEFRF